MVSSLDLLRGGARRTGGSGNFAAQLAAIKGHSSYTAPVEKLAPIGTMPDEAPADTPLVGAWHWLADIIDRPRRAIAEQVDSGIDALADVPHVADQIKRGDIGGAIGSIGGDIGRQATAGIRGLVSTNKDDQRTSSDLIEKAVDTYGKNNDPHYKNTQDNVNPLLKGIAGFVGDVATDPTTYIGLPGLGAIGRATKTSTQLSDLSAHVIKDTTGLGEKAAGAVAKDVDEVAKAKPLELTTGDPKITVDAEGNAVRTINGNPVHQPAYEPTPLVTESKVAATDPLLNPHADMFAKLTQQQQQSAHYAALSKLGPWFKRHIDPSNYTKVLKSGARVTESSGKEQLAKFTNQMGTHAGFDLHREFAAPIMKDADELVKLGAKKGGLKPGIQRAEYISDRMRTERVAAEALLDSKGAEFHIDWRNERLSISPQQVLDIISSHPEGKRAVDLALYNHSTAVPLTKILEAAVIAIHNTDTSAGAALLHLQSAGGMRVRNVTMQNFGAKAPGTAAKVVGVKGNKVTNDEVLRGLMAGLTDAGQHSKFTKTIAENEASHQERFMGEYLQLSDEIKANVTALVDEPDQLGNALKAITGAPEYAAKRGVEAETYPASARAAADQFAEDLPEGVASTADAGDKVASAAKRLDEASARAAFARGSKDAADAAQGRAQQAFKDIPEEELGDAAEASVDLARGLADQAYRGVTNGFLRIMDPLAKKFRPDRGMEGLGLYQMQNAAGITMRSSIADSAKKINALAVAGKQELAPGRTILVEAMEHYLKGTASANPAVTGLMPGIQEVMTELIPRGGGNSLLGSAFLRTGSNLEWLAARMGDDSYKFGTGVGIDIERARKDAKGLGISEIEAAFRQAGEWDVKDPAQFMMSLQVMAARAAHEATVQAQAEAQLVKLGHASYGPKTGMMKATYSKSSPLAAFAHPELRLTQEGANALQAMHDLITPKRGGSFEQFLKNYFDPVQNLWKFGVTLPRPGHHVRNLVGNLSMNYMAEGMRFSKQATTDATKLFAARGSYEGLDATRMLQQLGDVSYKGGGEKLFHTKLGDLTTEEVWQRAKNSGILNSFHEVQAIDNAGRAAGIDSIDETTSAISKLSDKVTNGNKVTSALGKVSEANDHFSKMIQLSQILRKYEKDGFITARWGQKVRPKTTDELFNLAAERVRFYHPDGTTLTRTERGVVKRIIPFYSWMRGAVVSIAESAVLHPGRASVFTKASYNLAVANGVHPDSLADPFPTDQVFPSFLQENVLGPQFKIGGQYFMASPGVATVDMANSAPGGNPVKGLIGMASPLLRVPVEVATGNSLTTGAQIKDWSDYVDQQLPLISNIASTSGYSATGSIAGVLAGQGADETLQVRKGNKDHGDTLTAGLLSSLLGVQTTNESQPNYIKSAEYEQRDKAKAAAGDSTASRTGF